MIGAPGDLQPEERRQIRRLRLMSLAEGLTLLLLILIALPARHLLGLPVATRIMGPIHGLTFLAYCWTLLATVTGGTGWSGREVAKLTLAAFVPFGAMTVAGLLRRKEAAAEMWTGRS